jgi:hypothetical protein
VLGSFHVNRDVSLNLLTLPSWPVTVTALLWNRLDVTNPIQSRSARRLDHARHLHNRTELRVYASLGDYTVFHHQ